MTKAAKMILATVLAALGVFWGTGIAVAGTATCGACTNQQSGDNGTTKTQDGSATSGDAVGGQVVGIVSSGNASVDAKNRSERVDITTGNAIGNNNSSSFTGLNSSTSTTIRSAADNTLAGLVTNQQSGDNDFDLSQTANATSGDGVGGQVIGVVTSAGGSAKVVADNGSKRIDIATGTANAENESAAFVGLNANATGTLVTAGTAFAGVSTNQQDGDNSLTGTQDSTSTSGDGVGGQVLGVVSAGKASLDAKNRSERIDISTGDATSESSNAAFVGLNYASETRVVQDAGTTALGVGFNQQEGNNSGDFTQTANATSGDGVAGQVAGVVTSAGGSADAVLDNGSLRIDLTSGTSTFTNTDNLFVGLNVNTNTLTIGP